MAKKRIVVRLCVLPKFHKDNPQQTAFD